MVCLSTILCVHLDIYHKLLRRVDTHALSKTNVNYFVYMVDKNKIISEEVIGFVTRCLEEEIHPETCPPWN